MDIDPRTNYAAKVAIGLGIVFLITSVGGGFTVVTAQSSVQQQEVDALGGQADVQDDVIDGFVGSISDEGKQTASRISRIRVEYSDTRSSRLAQIKELLKSRVGTNDRLRAVHYVDRDSGTILESSEPQRAGTALADRGYEMPASFENGKLHLRFSTYEGTSRWTFYVPIGDDRVLVKSVDPGAIASEVDPIMANTTTRVVTEAGIVALDADNTSAIGTQHVPGPGVNSPAVRAGLGGGENTTRVSGPNATTGETLVVGYDQIDGGWALVSYASPERLFGVANGVARNIMLLIALVGLTLVGFGIVVERRAVRTLNALESTAESLSDGALEATIASDRQDQFGSVFESLDAMRSNLHHRIADAESAREEAEQSRERAEEAKAAATQTKQELESMVETLRAEAVTVMEDAADGDLTVRMEIDDTDETIERIGTAFNEMMDDIETTVAEIQGFTEEVVDSAESVTAGTQEGEAVSDDVSESIQVIADDADQQSTQLDEVAGETQRLSGTIEEVASAADETAELAERTATSGERGRTAAAAAVDEMTAIEQKTETTIDEMEALAAEIDRIGEIVDLITNIAAETNMLALNASIEAARAGEAGEGFAVVADEIKSLAEEVNEATDEVESLIDEVEAKRDTAIADIEETGRRVSSGAETIQDTVDALDEIATNVESVNESVHEIKTATGEQATSIEAVAQMTDDVVETAEHVASESDNVSAAAEEQTSLLTRVSESAESLSDQAEEVQKTVARFTVSVHAEPRTDLEYGGSTTPPASDSMTVGTDSGADEDSE